MKHIKLFEEFSNNSKYELKPGADLPENGIILFENTDQYDFLGQFLIDQGYEDVHEAYHANTRARLERDLIAIRWSIKEQYGGGNDKSIVFVVLKNRSGLLNFSDYFQLKHEHRGHNLKKFGI